MPANHLKDQHDLVNIFFQDGTKLASEYLVGGITEQSLSGLMSAAYEAVDGLILSFRNRCLREGYQIDCRAGCSWCCHQVVLVSTQEVLLIGSYLSKQLADDQREVIYRRAREKEALTGNMPVQEFLQTLHPCPFLMARSCIIYPVRPMACRCYLSADVESCLAQYRQPGDHRVMAALYEFPLHAGRALNEGIRAVLMKHGIVTSEWLLEVFISKMFAQTGIFNQWLSGGDPFAIRSLTAHENEYLRQYRQGKGSFKNGE
jgi:hypothetical protein